MEFRMLMSVRKAEVFIRRNDPKESSGHAPLTVKRFPEKN